MDDNVIDDAIHDYVLSSSEALLLQTYLDTLVTTVQENTSTIESLQSDNSTNHSLMILMFIICIVSLTSIVLWVVLIVMIVSHTIVP